MTSASGRRLASPTHCSNATLKTPMPACAVRLAAGSATPRAAQGRRGGRGERGELDQLALLQLLVGGDDGLAGRGALGDLLEELGHGVEARGHGVDGCGPSGAAAT